MRLHAPAPARPWEDASSRKPTDAPTLTLASADAASPEPLPAKQAIELAQILHADTDGQVKFADTKASIIVFIVGLLTARLADTFKQGALQELWAGGVPGRFGCVCFALTFLTLLACIAKAVLAIKPTIRKNAGSSLFFFGSISGMPQEQFVRSFRAQTPDEVPDAILAQAHVKATITTRKMARIAASFRFLLAALALWTASIVCAALVH